MRPFQTIFIILITLSLSGLSHSSLGQQSDQNKWTYSIGLGMAATPSYLGDDEYQLLLFPYFGVKYGDKFFASFFEGIGYNLVKTNTWRVGPILKTNIGRFEDGTVPASITGKTHDLTGLGDIGFTLETGAYVEYTNKSITTKLEFRQGIGGHKGLIGEISSNYRSAFKFNKKTIYYIVGPEIMITGDNFNNAFFGIDPEQSANTEFESYDVKAGLLSYGMRGSLVVPITKKLSTMALLRYSKLTSKVSDTQLIREAGSAHQSTIGFMVNYTL